MASVVITGVSSGIGQDAARLLMQHGYHVFGSVRRPEDAAALQRDGGAAFTPLCFDVTDGPAILRAAAEVSARLEGRGLTALVNNAGITLNGPLMHLPLEDFTHLFDVNVVGVHRVTQAFLSMLGASRTRTHAPGRIINISSVAGRLAMPFLAAYGATKHALEGYSDGLRRELLIYGIPVVVIEPGVIDTPIWDKRETISRFANTDYGVYHQPLLDGVPRLKARGLPARAVSVAIQRALESPRPRTRYAVVPYGLRGLLKGWWIPRLLPDAWLDARVKRGWDAIQRCMP